MYLTQLNTAIFIIDLINTRSNLTGDCRDLRNGNATLAAAVAINMTQAADFVCAAYAANLTSINPTLLQIFATALYAVELAGNFTGTTNTTTLCNSVDVDILTLPIFGVDGQGVQSYVCSAFNATTLTTTFSTVTSGTAASAGTITQTIWGNQTSFGTAPIATGPIGTGTGIGTVASTPTVGRGWPFGNSTGTRTRSFTGPRTNSGSGRPQPTGTSSPFSRVSASSPFAGSGFDQPSGTDSSGPNGMSSGIPNRSGDGQPTGTNVSGSWYGNLTGFPTGYGSGYIHPSGTGVSGGPYGNLTAFPTGSGSGYAHSTGTGGSDDPLSIQLSSYDPPSTARLPPNPSTSHYYPAVLPSTSSVMFYGYGYGRRD